MNSLAAPDETADMQWIPGGLFRMGSDDHYPEEAPAHPVRVDGFWMDATTVTNARFAQFVASTGYVTVAERELDPAEYPDAVPGLLKPGGLVFVKPPRPVPMNDLHHWWTYVPGACWRHPEGPRSSIEGRDHHPAVHVVHEDAEAYARWCGKELPTEAEWEFAARGGLDGAEFAWGDELTPAGRHLANTWQGEFPWHNTRDDGYERTAPVRAYPPNGYGLHEMIGNVWEWTTDWYRDRHKSPNSRKACCVPANPRGPSVEHSFAATGPGARIPRKVLKGGSFLCAPNYCRRYRPAARFPHMVDSPACHIGFRCVVRDLARATRPTP